MLVQIVKDNSTLNGMQIFNNLYLIRWYSSLFFCSFPVSLILSCILLLPFILEKFEWCLYVKKNFVLCQIQVKLIDISSYKIIVFINLEFSSTPRGPMYQSLTTILSAMSNMIHEWFRGWLISGSLERSNIKVI